MFGGSAIVAIGLPRRRSVSSPSATTPSFRISTQLSERVHAHGAEVMMPDHPCGPTHQVGHRMTGCPTLSPSVQREPAQRTIPQGHGRDTTSARVVRPSAEAARRCQRRRPRRRARFPRTPATWSTSSSPRRCNRSAPTDYGGSLGKPHSLRARRCSRRSGGHRRRLHVVSGMSIVRGRRRRPRARGLPRDRQASASFGARRLRLNVPSAPPPTDADSPNMSRRWARPSAAICHERGLQGEVGLPLIHAGRILTCPPRAMPS